MSHKLQMQMRLCPFPINSSRQRVSSRSRPQFFCCTKISRGGESVRATLWQYSHSHVESEHLISIEISSEGENQQRGGEKRKFEKRKRKFVVDSSARPGAGSWLAANVWVLYCDWLSHHAPVWYTSFPLSWRLEFNESHDCPWCW